jgi:hypothetical protein
MSADSPAIAASVGRWQLDVRSLRILRYALGSTLAMTIAMGFNWQLSYLAPVLCLSFLASPAPRPTLKQGLSFVAVVAFACFAGLKLGQYLISYPLVYIPFSALLLLRIFYMMASGRSPLLTTWLLIALLVIPLITITSPAIANMVAAGILTGASVTICVVWLAHGLLPDPRGPGSKPVAVATAAAAAPPELPPALERFKTAAISTLVVLPVLTLFYSFKLQSALLVLIFVALLSAQPGFAANFKAGSALIVGNVMGGAAAILMYELLFMVPQFYFLVLLTFLAGLVFGTRVFTDKPMAKLWGMAFSTLLLVIASTTASGTGEAGSKVYVRVAQITVAVVWVVMASGAADRFIRRKEAAR